jgi:hypothetical protein
VLAAWSSDAQANKQATRRSRTRRRVHGLHGLITEIPDAPGRYTPAATIRMKIAAAAKGSAPAQAGERAQTGVSVFSSRRRISGAGASAMTKGSALA